MTAMEHIKKSTKRLTVGSVLVSTLIALVFTLVVYNMRDMLFGAPLTVVAAADGATLTDSFVPLKGTALHAKELSVNGREIAIDRTGAFDDSILLSTGYNIVEVALTDRFGNQKVKTYHWVVNPSESVATLSVPSYQSE